ncbi:MAG: EF-P lysine aminoacylase EpmA [Fibrobacterales bacterium]
MSDFKPTLSIETARKRADLIHKIRSFFHAIDVLEVETPILSRGSGLDPYIDVYDTDHYIDGTETPKEKRYLSTSPEFFMKRMLAAGYPSIFQICKAFRNGESGPIHNPEFTILEWYRVGMSYRELIVEVMDLVNELGDFGPYSVITYRDAFLNYLKVDPHKLTVNCAMSLAEAHDLPTIESDNIDEWLIYILSQCVEPNLGKDGPELLCDYPASQAALAQTYTDQYDTLVAKRFELYINGVELCNGYEELIDPKEQERRFTDDVEKRKELGKRILSKDDFFLDALQSGVPQCAGVAIGLDRLIMLILGEEDLSKVLSFPFSRS